MIESLTDAYQQIGVDGTASEYIIDIGAVTIEFAGKSSDREATRHSIEMLFDEMPDMDFRM